MDDLVINLLIFAAIAIFSVIKHLRKGKDGAPPRPPRADRPPRPQRPARPSLPAPEGHAPPQPEPEPERIDLSFLQETLESLGIDLPEEARAELEDEYDAYDEDDDRFDEIEVTPPEPAPLPEIHAQSGTALYQVEPPRPVRPRPTFDAEAAEVSPFFGDLDDHWDPSTQTKVSGKTELIRDAVVLGAMLAPFKRH